MLSVFIFFLLHVFSKLSPQKFSCISSDLWCAGEVYQRALFQGKKKPKQTSIITARHLI